MGRDTDGWGRILSVLEEALALPAVEVPAYLDRVCAGDVAMRAEVEALIAADGTAPAFLDGRAVPLRVTPSPACTSLEGARLGAYRVLGEIGRGGMSVVHLGERADGQFEQRVAIKVLQRDATTAGMGERLRAERRILGALDHRGIVRILDGGVSGDGRPYLVMDHIEGERIDRWCDERSLSITDRLRLFRQVLDAVGYAHRALVVHRDLKPDNILVTPDGRVRLLDFGIAKLLAAEEDLEATPTRTGLRAMTPAYASPEQIRGDPITTVSDIYALGVLLFELLAGQRPYALKTTTPWAHEQAVLEGDPGRPSDAVRSRSPAGERERTAEMIAAARGTEPTRLQGALDGDLDAIVLKALRKEPEARYGTADAFGEDIDRHLGSLPVLARRGTREYRLRKFVRRHRGGVAMAAVAALLGLGATGLIVASRAREVRARVSAEEQRIAAEREARTAREVTDFLVAVFAGSNPFATLSDSVSARTLLERGRDRIDRELLDAPLVRASLLQAIGQVYSGLGRYEAADTLLREAADLRERELGGFDAAVAEAYEALGENGNARRDFPGALTYLERAWTVRSALDADATPPLRRAGLLQNLAVPLRELGQADSARTLLEQALALDRSRSDTASGAHSKRLLGLAATLRALEEMDSASRVYAHVLPRLRGLADDDPLTWATALNNAAFLHTRQERWEDAVPLYREALALTRDLLGPDHPRVVSYLSNLASALFRIGEHDQALRALEERMAAVRRTFPDGHWRVGAGHQGMGKMLIEAGRFADAEAEFRAAVASFTATIGAGHTWTLVAETWVIVTLTLRQDPRAAGLLDRALARLDGARLDGDTSADLGRIADHLQAAGMMDRANAFRALLPAAG